MSQDSQPQEQTPKPKPPVTKPASQPRRLSKAVSDDLKRAEADNEYKAVKAKVNKLKRDVFKQDAKIGFMERQDVKRGITTLKKNRGTIDNRIYQSRIPGEKRKLDALEAQLDEAKDELATFTN